MFRICATMIGFLVLCQPAVCKAASSFLDGNPFVAQDRLMTDILEKKLEPSDFTAEGLLALESGGPFGVNPETLGSLGAVQKICMLFGLKDTESEMLAFRVVHVNGCGDWGVRIVLRSNKIQNASMVKLQFLEGDRENCGPPGILPAVTDSASFFTLPATVSCRKRTELNKVLSDAELKAMCKVATGLCDEAN